MCLVDVTCHNNSYRRHLGYIGEHAGPVNTYGLKRVPSKSGLHGWADELGGCTGLVRELPAGLAGDGARGTLLGDSPGFSIVKYEDWKDARRGIISRREFNKLHVLVAPRGRIVTCAVTGGRWRDSPVLRETHGRIPEGHGRIILDAVYLSRVNCKMIARGGRRPVARPKRNSKARGLHSMGQMLKWHESDRDGLDRIYHQRSPVETALSVIKERLGAVARARTFRMRQL